MKYSKEFKLDCVMRHRNGNYIPTPSGFSVRDNFMCQVRKWRRFYDSLGEVGLEHGRPTIRFDERLKLIKRVESGESYSSVAYSVGINSCLLIKWHKIYKESGIDGLKLLKRGRPSMTKTKIEVVNKKPKDMSKEELLEALELATIENEYLKKLSALVQKRKAQERKKK